MTTVPIDNAETSRRTIPFRRRADLNVAKMLIGGRTYWNIKDPVTLDYYQLREEEYFVLSMLDGRATVEEIQQAFSVRFAPRRLSDSQLQAFLHMLHGQGLLVANVAGQGDQLWQRRQNRARTKVLSSLMSILAIRFRGIDPEQMLCWLYPKLRWMFSWWCVSAAILVAISAMALIFANHEAMLARLPGFHAFFHFENLVWIAASVAIAKVFHELAHALACKHFGGECHEMGILLLVFTPCLYCNVSDAWMMKNKWHRAGISAAGIYVEIVLASVCTFLWWFSEPGLLNAICLNMMFVCSLGTVLFNGNPLLRYDGYYILSDLVEIPNLRGQAMMLLRNKLAWLCLGAGPAKRRMLPDRRRKFLLFFAIASLGYRILVVAGILWFLQSVLRPYGLQVVAQLIAVLVLGGMVLTPLWQFIRFLSAAMRSGQVSIPRTVIFLGAFASGLAAILLVPLPSYVYAPLVIEPEGATTVFAPVSGRLTSTPDAPCARAGDKVHQGSLLARLDNFALEEEIARLNGQVEVLRARSDSLNAIRVSSDSAGDQIPAANEALRNAENRLQQKTEELRRLSIHAPVRGMVLPPKRIAVQPAADELETWTGTPLDIHNVGCQIESGTPICLIGDPDRVEAILIIDQSNVEFVSVGQDVKLWLKQVPGNTLTGKIVELSKSDLREIPRELLSNEELPAMIDNTGTARPASSSYQARVRIDQDDARILLHTTGKSRIAVAPQPLGSRLLRFLASTFRFDV